MKNNEEGLRAILPQCSALKKYIPSIFCLNSKNVAPYFDGEKWFFLFESLPRNVIYHS
jgi:hypothetical protein